MLEENKEYDIEIFDMSNKGEGIGRIDGMVVFVPGLIPGDTAAVKITRVKKNLANAETVQIKYPSSDRTEPRCEYFGKCGGCTLQNMKYPAQLELKEKQLRDKLERIYGGETPQIEPIIGMENPWNYRNKATCAVYAGKAIAQKDGSVKNAERPRVGYYDGKGRNVVECLTCPIQTPVTENVIQAVREYIKQSGITIYDENTHKGRLRQVIVRTGYYSHEVMVVIIVNGKKITQPQLLADLLYDGIEKLNEKLESEFETAEPEWYELKSLIVNYNNNISLSEISPKTEILYGNPSILDTCNDLEFEISPFSFYQVNPVQMEKLYQTVLEFADLKGTETIFDLYCGIGTIGLYCARQAGYVWGIESSKSSILDANRNAVINRIVNIQFLQGKAEEKIFDLAEPTDDNPNGIHPDIVILDPPRAGCKPELLNAIRRASPEKIIYVSCDPGTLARDLRILSGLADEDNNETNNQAIPETNNQTTPETIPPAPNTTAPGNTAQTRHTSYKIKTIRQIDQFCHSLHVESVALLTKSEAM